jgi:methyl-accepting chemotaxis protein
MPIKTATFAGIEKMNASLGLSSQMRSISAKLADQVTALAGEAAGAYLDHLSANVASLRPDIERHRVAIVDAEVKHFSLLFSSDLDEHYVSSLNDGTNTEFAEVMGARVRLGTAARVIDRLFADVGRRHRFSGRETARECLAIAKLLMSDSLAASVCHQKAAAAAQDARRGDLETASTTFQSNIAAVTDSLFENAALLKERSLAARRDSHKAGACAEAAEEAAAKCAATAIETNALSEAFARALDGVEAETTRSEQSIKRSGERARAVGCSVTEVAAAAERIVSVVSLIGDIANQTNLLALNATIEAARAGDVGRGFSIVASEVKALAQQTANAAAEIAKQIADLQSIAGNSVQQIQTIEDTAGELARSGRTIQETVHGQVATTTAMSSSVRDAISQSEAGLEAARLARSTMAAVVDVTQEVDDAVSEMVEAIASVRASSGNFLSSINVKKGC